jgi:hypothetical protein
LRELDDDAEEILRSVRKRLTEAGEVVAKHAAPKGQSDHVVKQLGGGG